MIPKQFFFCKKRTKKTFALRRGGGEAGPASQGESFCALFSKSAA
jgi:hypothetical protein